MALINLADKEEQFIIDNNIWFVFNKMFEASNLHFSNEELDVRVKYLINFIKRTTNSVNKEEALKILKLINENETWSKQISEQDVKEIEAILGNYKLIDCNFLTYKKSCVILKD